MNNDDKIRLLKQAVLETLSALNEMCVVLPPGAVLDHVQGSIQGAVKKIQEMES